MVTRPPTHDTTMHNDDDWLSTVAGRTELGRAVQDLDWSSTPLGPPSDWSEGLRTAVSICLTTKFPALIVWGRNDTLVPIGFMKHVQKALPKARHVELECGRERVASAKRKAPPPAKNHRDFSKKRHSLKERKQ